MQTLLSWTPINGVWIKGLPLLENSLTFFGECVADSGPEEVVRRIRNNSIDEGMISKLRIIIFPEVPLAL